MCIPLLAPIGVALGYTGTTAAVVGTTVAVSTLATVAGAGFSAYSSIQQGKAQADIADMNAEFARRKAEDAKLRARQTVRRVREAGERLRGEQVARLAGLGVEVGSGSSLDIIESTARAVELDVLTIRSNAEREAYSANVAAAGFDAESDLFISSSRTQAGASLLSGAAKVAGNAFQLIPRPAESAP